MNGLRRLRLLPLLLLLLLAALLARLALSPPALAFPDVPADHPYVTAIADLAARGIVSGHLDGTFGPNEPVSRCQFAKMIVNTLGIAHTDLSMPFHDVGPSDLPEFVAAAARAGITRGTDATGEHFSPWRSISRAQVITMVVRALEREHPDRLYPLWDLSPWGAFDQVHAQPAAIAYASRLLDGLPLADLDPWAPMPRGEVAQVLHSALSERTGSGEGVVAGLVLGQPVSLDEARSLGDELLGEVVALYRTDHACVPENTPGSGDAQQVPSRFSYVDAFSLQERALSESFVRTPIADLEAARATWAHWQDQWRHAQEPGVLFEALAVHVSESTLVSVRNDPRVRAVEILPHRWLDGGNIGPYLLLESEDFPPGVLTEPPPPSCGSLPSGEAELDAIVSDLKAASPEANWAELMRGPTQAGPRKVIGLLEEEMIGQFANGVPAPPSGGFVLYVGGDPKHKLLCYFNFDLQGEDPRYQNLWNRAGGGVQNLGLHTGTLAVWGDPSPGPGFTSADAPELLAPGEELVESFHVLYMEYQ